MPTCKRSLISAYQRRERPGLVLPDGPAFTASRACRQPPSHVLCSSIFSRCQLGSEGRATARVAPRTALRPLPVSVFPGRVHVLKFGRNGRPTGGPEPVSDCRLGSDRALITGRGDHEVWVCRDC